MTAIAPLLQLLLQARNPNPALPFAPPFRSRRPTPPGAKITSAATSTSTPTCPPEEAASPTQSPDLLLAQIDQIILNPFLIDGRSSSLAPASVLGNVDRDHERDVCWAEASLLPFESQTSAKNNLTVEYELIQDEAINENRTIAIRTKQSTPLLNEDEIQLLKNASISYWERNCSGEESEKSRFTFQRKGNSEAHLSDVLKYTRDSNVNDINALVNELLLNRIYPWIREAYLSKEEDGRELELYVYDSLFIRYNATQAHADNICNQGVGRSETRVVGAGQPLHRDLGYVSVNIMLNPEEEFAGGGTFFENQLRPTMLDPGNAFAKEEMFPLKPFGPGFALAHLSSDRHAGAATLSGVRDILVIFLAAAEKKSLFPSRPRKAPRWERNARLKSAARSYHSNDIHAQLLCRIQHHRLAVDQIFNDGEAWHYLGMALLDYHDYLRLNADAASDGNRIANAEAQRNDITINHSVRGRNSLKMACSCLGEAAKHTPCDGRLYNNLGIALERFSASNADTIQEEAMGLLHDRISSAYQKSIMIHSACEKVGCDVGADYERACLNYGLYLSKLDRFDDAIDVLSRVPPPSDVSAEVRASDAAPCSRQRVIKDAANLLSFCTRKMAERLEKAR